MQLKKFNNPKEESKKTEAKYRTRKMEEIIDRIFVKK